MTAMDVMYGIPHLLWTTSVQAGVMAGAIWLACRQWPRMPANLRVMLWWLVSLKFVIGLVWTQPIPLPVLPASLAPPDSQIASIASVASVARTTDSRQSSYHRCASTHRTTRPDISAESCGPPRSMRS